MFLAVDGRLAGLVAVADPSKASAAAAINALHAAGLRIIMATGDGLTTARAVATELGLDAVHGKVSPEDKDALAKDNVRNPAPNEVNVKRLLLAQDKTTTNI